MVDVDAAEGRRSGCGESSLAERRVRSVCPSADELSDGRPSARHVVSARHVSAARQVSAARNLASARHVSTVRVAPPPPTARNTSSSALAGAALVEWTAIDGHARRGLGVVVGEAVDGSGRR